MVELRKRKDPPTTTPAAKRVNKAKTEASPAPKSVVAGDVITVEGFGGPVELQDGGKTDLATLLAQSKSGVVLFTYPKASTPGCTTQVCLFRDAYVPLADAGLSIFGLSRDSTNANTKFKTKHSLQYPLLCDPSAQLIKAIGFKNGDKTQRGVFVVDKHAKVLVSEPGGPAATLQAVQAILSTLQRPDTSQEGGGAKSMSKLADTDQKTEA